MNYTVPFTHGFITANRLGIDLKKAIDNDGALWISTDGDGVIKGEK